MFTEKNKIKKCFYVLRNKKLFSVFSVLSVVKNKILYLEKYKLNAVFLFPPPLIPPARGGKLLKDTLIKKIAPEGRHHCYVYICTY